MLERRRTSSAQRPTRGPSWIGILYRRCALILSQIRAWTIVAEPETYRIPDQSGYLKLLVYERKCLGGVAESYEDRYEDVIRIESPHRSPSI